MANAAVAVFAKMWPSIEEALVLPVPEAAELRAAAARCCTLAVRASAAGFRPVAASFAAVAARVFPEPGGHHFSASLGAALEVYAGDAIAGSAVMNALAAVAALPSVISLRVWGAGDNDVDFTRVRLKHQPLGD